MDRNSREGVGMVCGFVMTTLLIYFFPVPSVQFILKWTKPVGDILESYGLKDLQIFAIVIVLPLIILWAAIFALSTALCIKIVDLCVDDGRG